MNIEVSPERQAEWVAALRSGKFEQGAGYLKQFSSDYDGGVAHCCLGVLCETAELAEFRTQDQLVVRFESETNELAELLETPGARGWLAGTDVPIYGMRIALKAKVLTNDTVYFDKLEALNDRGHTFKEIADFIERNGIVLVPDTDD